MTPAERDWDRARANMIQHRRLIAARRQPAEQHAVLEQLELELDGHKVSRAVRRAALLERLRRVGRYFDPLGDHR